ncbi:MFS transporter [Nocardioides sp. CBS4Y-1]|uniref:MFS transporter n=1 Tax=Nocardioides acrostichi TaxID=2784339 RepID=A0A930V151_9ACTN|nr:MFS transporter [Nocardioides acrostichi]
MTKRGSRPARSQREPLPGEIRVLVASAFVIALGYGIVAPVLPAYARSFDVGVAAASLVVSAFAFFRLVFAPGGGALIARLGERPVYLTGLGIVAASSLATAFAQSYTQLLVLRGLGGLGSTMFTVSAMALLVRLAPPTMRGRVTSAWASTFLIGGMLGPVLGGSLAQFGLRAPFVVYAGALVLAALAVGFRLSGARLRPAPDAPPRPVMPVREALSHRTYRAALVSAFANGWCNFGVRVAVLPQLAVAITGATWAAGVSLAVAAAATAVALQAAGRLTDRIGRRPLVLAGLGVTAVGLVALGTSTTLWVLLPLAAVSGLGAGLVNPGQQAAVADVVGNERTGGTVLSTFQMCQDAGAILGPVLTGVVADHAGFGPAYALTALVSALAIGPWLRAPETRPLVDGSEPAG